MILINFCRKHTMSTGILSSCLGSILGIVTIYHSIIDNVYADEITFYIIALVISLILIFTGYVLIKISEER